MPSAVIRSFAYRPQTRELEVAFTTGRRYVYAEVPRPAAEALRASFAKGRHFNRHIRGRFPHRELAPDEPEAGGADPALGWGGG
jgi:hypothetical protein